MRQLPAAATPPVCGPVAASSVLVWNRVCSPMTTGGAVAGAGCSGAGPPGIGSTGGVSAGGVSTGGSAGGGDTGGVSEGGMSVGGVSDGGTSDGGASVDGGTKAVGAATQTVSLGSPNGERKLRMPGVPAISATTV